MYTRLTHVRTFTIAIGMGLSLLLVGCMPPANPDTYGNKGAGMSAEVQHGVITDVRSVKLKGSNWGAPVGAAAGGVGGSFIGGDTRLNILGAIGGAAAGAVAGYYIDQTLTSRDANQYIIALNNKKTIAVVQGKEPALVKGQHVLVLIDKQKTRVVPDSDYAVPAAAKSTTSKAPATQSAAAPVDTKTASTDKTADAGKTTDKTKAN